MREAAGNLYKTVEHQDRSSQGQQEVSRSRHPARRRLILPSQQTPLERARKLIEREQPGSMPMSQSAKRKRSGTPDTSESSSGRGQLQASLRSESWHHHDEHRSAQPLDSVLLSPPRSYEFAAGGMGQDNQPMDGLSPSIGHGSDLFANSYHPDLPLTARSIESQHSGKQSSVYNDGGLSNPVKLLAEAAEEISASDRTAADIDIPAYEEHGSFDSSLPPHYSLTETLHAIISEGPSEPRTLPSSLDETYLAEGLASLLADNARRRLDWEDRHFFNPPCREVKRDLGPENCPLSLALVTPREVKAFFATFFSRFHPMLPVLDPHLHTTACKHLSTARNLIQSG